MPRSVIRTEQPSKANDGEVSALKGHGHRGKRSNGVAALFIGLLRGFEIENAQRQRAAQITKPWSLGKPCRCFLPGSCDIDEMAYSDRGGPMVL